jgi:hypothetical protein
MRKLDARQQLEAASVFAQYGKTMLSVQLFEGMLASLALVAGVKTPGRKVAAHGRERFFRRSFARHWHAFRRSSARESYRALEGRIDAELLEQIDTAIKWRDRLAHRYLREKFVASDDRVFTDEAMGELIKLEKSFDRLGRRLIEEARTMTADWPRNEAPPEARRALEQLSLAIAFDRPLQSSEKPQSPESGARCGD